MPHLLTFGDSNTFGTMPIFDEDIRERLVPGARWPGVALAGLPGWLLTEEGLPGRTTCHPCAEMGPHMDGRVGLLIALQSHGPIDVMTLMLGTNDLKAQFDVPPEQIAADAGMLLDIALSEEMQGRHGGFQILLICPPPVLETGLLAEAFTGARAKSLALAPLYQAEAEARGLAYLNAGEVIESSPVDGIHFGAEMHERLGKAVAGAVRGLA